MDSFGIPRSCVVPRAPGPSRFIGPLCVLLAVMWITYVINGFRPPTRPIVVVDGDVGARLRQALYAGSAMAAMAALLVRRRLGPMVATQAGLLVLVLIVLASTLWSTVPAVTMKRGILLACGVMTCGALVHLPADPLRLMVRTVGTMAGVGAWMSLAWRVALPAAHSTNPERPGLAGVAEHPNTLGPLLAIGIVILAGWTCHSRRDAAWRTFLVVGCVVAIAMTNSMSSIGTAAVGLLALILARGGGAVRILLVLGIGLGASVVTVVGPDAIAEAALGRVGRDASFSGRDELWALVRARIARQPLFGHGWGGFWTEGRGRALVGTWNPRQSHHAYLDIMLDLGVVGLILVGVVVHGRIAGLAVWTAARRRDDELARAATALLAASIAILSVYALQQSFLLKVDSFPFIVLLWTAMLARRIRIRPAPVGGE